MPIACTTVAGATAIISQFKKNLITKLKGSSDYKEFPSKSQYTSKGPQIYCKHNCDLPQTPNTTAYIEYCMLPLYGHQHCIYCRHCSCQRFNCRGRHYSRQPQLLVALTIRNHRVTA